MQVGHHGLNPIREKNSNATAALIHGLLVPLKLQTSTKLIFFINVFSQLRRHRLSTDM